MESTYEYRVLWIDDQHEDLDGIKLEAEEHNIQLIPYKSLEGGMAELEKNSNAYDGVILDARFFEREDQVPGTEDLASLLPARDRINALPKHFEIFILTGQIDIIKEKKLEEFGLDYFEKNNDDDLERLFSSLKSAADNQEDTQIRKNHIRAFQACEADCIGGNSANNLLDILKRKDEEGSDDLFTKVRKIVEDLFKSFHRNKLLPEEFVSPQVSINGSSKFLSGLVEKEYQLNEESRLPKTISSSLRYILKICQPASHRTETDDHINSIKASYLLNAVVNALLDVLLWYRIHLDSNPVTENWEKLESPDNSNIMWIAGEVKMVHPKGFGFFRRSDGGEDVYIPPNLVNEHSLEKGTSIHIEIEEYQDQGSQEIKTKAKAVKFSQA